MSEDQRLTLREYNLVKRIILNEFDREVEKRININFFNTVSNLPVSEDKKEELRILEIKEQCGLKLYAEIFELYSGYNSYARYTAKSMDHITDFLASKGNVTEMFLNISHEVGILLSTNDLSTRKLFETLQNGFSSLIANPSDETVSLLNKNMLSSIFFEDKALFSFLEDNLFYVVIILLLSYFDESSFYKTYNECYKGKK